MVRPDMFACLLYRESPGYIIVLTQGALNLVGSHGERALSLLISTSMLHFQARGHSFALYGLTLSRSIMCLSFFPVVNWLTSGYVYATLSLNWLKRLLKTIRKI